MFTCFLILLNFDSRAQIETRYFNIIHNKKSIGTLEAKKETKGENIVFTNQTIISTRILTKIEVEYMYEVAFFRNELTTSHVVIKLNGNQRVKTITEKTNGIYSYFKNDSKENTINELIQSSTIMLLFDEPISILKVYAEEHGIFHQLKKIDDHEYLKISPDGKKNLYKYKNGSLDNAEIQAGIVNFSMVRTFK